MSGKKGRSGRKPAPKTRVDRMLAESDSQLEEIWQGLVDLAKGVRIGTLNEDGEMVNVYAKPPDREAIAEITNRHFGRTRIELDQRLKSETEVTLAPSKMLQALREVQKVEAEFMGYPSVEAMRQAKIHDHIARLEARLESPERQLLGTGLQDGGTTQRTTPTLPDASGCADIP
jgi:hypothetical protein